MRPEVAELVAELRAELRAAEAEAETPAVPVPAPTPAPTVNRPPALSRSDKMWGLVAMVAVSLIPTFLGQQQEQVKPATDNAAIEATAELREQMKELESSMQEFKIEIAKSMGSRYTQEHGRRDREATAKLIAESCSRGPK